MTSTAIQPKQSSEIRPKLLKDVVAGFTFSRLPREERIARTMYEIMSNEVTGLESDDIYDNGAIVLKIRGNADLLALATMLEPYARKDFAVRYGHLDDGKA